MRILITESQIIKLVDKYIDNQFHINQFRIVRRKKYPTNMYWIDENNRAIFELSTFNTFWVPSKFWHEIRYVFSFDYKTMKNVMKEWVEFKFKLNVDNVGMQNYSPIIYPHEIIK